MNEWVERNEIIRLCRAVYPVAVISFEEKDDVMWFACLLVSLCVFSSLREINVFLFENNSDRIKDIIAYNFRRILFRIITVSKDSSAHKHWLPSCQVRTLNIRCRIISYHVEIANRVFLVRRRFIIWSQQIPASLFRVREGMLGRFPVQREFKISLVKRFVHCLETPVETAKHDSRKSELVFIRDIVGHAIHWDVVLKVIEIAWFRNRAIWSGEQIRDDLNAIFPDKWIVENKDSADLNVVQFDAFCTHSESFCDSLECRLTKISLLELHRWDEWVDFQVFVHCDVEFRAGILCYHFWIIRTTN